MKVKERQGIRTDPGAGAQTRKFEEFTERSLTLPANYRGTHGMRSRVRERH